MKSIVLGISVDAVSFGEAKARALAFLELDEGAGKMIFTPNPEFIMAARKDEEFRNILNRGDLVVPDGIGIVLAGKLNKIRFKGRVAGYDLVQAMLADMKTNGRTVYFLGGSPGVAEAAKKQMEKEHPGIKIVGVHDGYFNEREEEKLLSEIKKLKPDLLLVGLGFPRQEKWIYRYKNQLPCKVYIGVGGSFDVMCGRFKRAPEVYRKLGIEWLYRLVKQPSRIKRQIQLPLFALVAIWDKILSVFRKKDVKGNKM